jgi:hypothetical protein
VVGVNLKFNGDRLDNNFHRSVIDSKKVVTISCFGKFESVLHFLGIKFLGNLKRNAHKKGIEIIFNSFFVDLK